MNIEDEIKGKKHVFGFRNNLKHNILLRSTSLRCSKKFYFLAIKKSILLNVLPPTFFFHHGNAGFCWWCFVCWFLFTQNNKLLQILGL